MAKKRDIENITKKDGKMYAQNRPQSKQDSPQPAMQDLLGNKLRSYYDQMASEPVPDRFQQLLDELELRQNAKKHK